MIDITYLLYLALPLFLILVFVSVYFRNKYRNMKKTHLDYISKKDINKIKFDKIYRKNKI